MQIKGNLKDYYDHVAHLYGGGDPSIQYIRKRLAPLRQSDVFSRVGTIDVVQSGLMRLPLTDFNSKYNYKWLCVAGKHYLLVQTRLGDPYTYSYCDWKIFSEKEHPTLWKTFNSKKGWFGRDPIKSADYVGVFSDALVELSRKINAPVFTFTCDRFANAIVDGDIPILNDLGMAKLVSAEQMYQDISYFMGNIIKESPDMMPPSKMTDKEKIVGHGFDTRVSFRHRV